MDFRHDLVLFLGPGDEEFVAGRLVELFGEVLYFDVECFELCDSGVGVEFRDSLTYGFGLKVALFEFGFDRFDLLGPSVDCGAGGVGTGLVYFDLFSDTLQVVLGGASAELSDRLGGGGGELLGLVRVGLFVCFLEVVEAASTYCEQ